MNRINFNGNKVSFKTEQGKVFIISYESLLKYIDIDYQKQLAKDARDTIQKGELNKYQSKIIYKHTGISAKEAIEMAKEIGAPSKDRTSGRQAIRYLYPGIGSAMAYADYLVTNGSDIEEAIATSKDMIPLFEEIIRIERNNNLTA